MYLTIGKRDRAYGSYQQMRSTSSDATDEMYGLYTCRSGSGAAKMYGVYSNYPAADDYAGFFVGNVQIDGNLTVNGIVNTNTPANNAKNAGGLDTIRRALDLVKSFRPRMVRRGSGSNERNNSAGSAKSNGLQYGFTAEELRAVAPDLVRTTYYPAEYRYPEEAQLDTTDFVDGIRRNPPKETLVTPARTEHTIRVLELIPILTQAIREQGYGMEKVGKELKEMKELAGGIRNSKANADAVARVSTETATLKAENDRLRSDVSALWERLADLEARLTKLKSCAGCAGADTKSLNDDTTAPVDAPVRYYPNPASDRVTVSNPAGGRYTIEVIGPSGALFATVPARGVTTAVNTSNWTAGTYFFRVVRGGTVTGSEAVVIVR